MPLNFGFSLPGSMEGEARGGQFVFSLALPGGLEFMMPPLPPGLNLERLFSAFFNGGESPQRRAAESLPLPSPTWQEGAEKPDCVICQEAMETSGAACQLPCAHQFHRDCLKPWLIQRNTCPSCRYELDTDDEAYNREIAERRRAKEEGGPDAAGAGAPPSSAPTSDPATMHPGPVFITPAGAMPSFQDVVSALQRQSTYSRGSTSAPSLSVPATSATTPHNDATPRSAATNAPTAGAASTLRSSRSPRIRTGSRHFEIAPGLAERFPALSSFLQSTSRAASARTPENRPDHSTADVNAMLSSAMDELERLEASAPSPLHVTIPGPSAPPSSFPPPPALHASSSTAIGRLINRAHTRALGAHSHALSSHRSLLGMTSSSPTHPSYIRCHLDAMAAHLRAMGAHERFMTTHALGPSSTSSPLPSPSVLLSAARSDQSSSSESPTATSARAGSVKRLRRTSQSKDSKAPKRPKK